MSFCQKLGLVAVPATHRTVARFLVLKAETCKYNTINNYLSAITVLQRCYGYTMNYRENFMLILVLDGLKAILGTAVVQKIPLTPDELLSMYKLIPLSDSVNQVHWTIVVFCFRTILRKSNVLPDTGDLTELLVRRSGISFTSWGMLVRVLSTKTLKYRDRVLEIPICIISGSPFCAVTLLRQHFREYPASGDSPLFYKRVLGVQVPVRYRESLKFLKQMSSRIGKDPTTVGLHSLRRSGAYFMHQLGVPLEDIKCIGDWKSLAALMYLVSPLERKKRIDELIGQALAGL